MSSSPSSRLQAEGLRERSVLVVPPKNESGSTVNSEPSSEEEDDAEKSQKTFGRTPDGTSKSASVLNKPNF